jgi:hypothetical protein
MNLSLEQLALVAELAREAGRDDPLLHHRFCSPAARDVVKAIASGLEVNVRAGLRAGKTTTGAVPGIAFARGVRELDARTLDEQRAGEGRSTLLLPALPTPNIGILGVSTYKQSSESTLAVYMRMIGNVDHRVLHGPAGSIVDIRVKPDRARTEDPDRWSRIMVFPIGGELPKGIGAHWVHCDETPTQELWTQLRMRIVAGQPLYRWITHTPEDQTLWQWLMEDYAHPDPWKLEIILSVFDNQSLTAEQKRMQREKAARDPLGLARLYGLYVNLKGKNPWKPQAKLLQRWLDNCREPIREELLMLPSEIETDTGLKIESAYGTVYTWEDPLPGERYYIPGDSSLGIDDGEDNPKNNEHDGLECQVIRRGFRSAKPGLVARYGDYSGGYALGHLMALLGERYNDAVCDPDTTGGYGQSVLRGLADYRSRKYPDGYPHINRDRKLDARGKPYSARLGFVVTPGNKADLIECVRAALIRDSFDCPSAYTVKCLMEAIMDSKGRLVKQRGIKYEAFHCVARGMQLLLDRDQTESGTRRENEIEQAFRNEGIKGPIVRPRGGTGGLRRFQWSRP